MRLTGLVAGTLFTLLCGQAVAQFFSDEQVCLSLKQSAQGLYLAYPDGVRPVAREMNYNPSARFYFVTQPTGPDEGVWHIRTETIATAHTGTDQAFVYRAPAYTRCAMKLGYGPSPAFEGNDRFVELNRYADHHAPADGRWPLNQETGGLDKYFHLMIEDDQSKTGCIATDDSKVFDLWAVYGFDGVVRTKSRMARLHFVSPAEAQQIGSPKYDGLSSEIVYHGGSEPACFSFSGPIPTNSAAVQNSMSWGPIETSILIKRLKGRHVSATLNQSVRWTQ
jgi:hypothetical protein